MTGAAGERVGALVGEDDRVLGRGGTIWHAPGGDKVGGRPFNLSERVGVSVALATRRWVGNAIVLGKRGLVGEPVVLATPRRLADEPDLCRDISAYSLGV